MSSEHVYIDGFSIAGYRSFGPDLVRIGPFKKINFFIGRNNSGKSNILTFIRNYFEKALRGERLEYKDLDKHQGMSVKDKCGEIGFIVGGNNYRKLLEHCQRVIDGNCHGENKIKVEVFERIFNSKTLAPEKTIVWWKYEDDQSHKLSRILIEKIYQENIYKQEEWRNMTRRLNIGMHAEPINNISTILTRVNPSILSPPVVEIIPAIRKIGAPGSAESGLDGEGIIEQLADLQHPSIGQDRSKKQKHFEEINTFLQTVTENENIRLEIPNDKQAIYVDTDGHTLPISHLGTGIHEVVILAAAATVLENQVLCIEEPELHLHPRLQKQLVRYLQEKTTNQYFISTHSAHLLDTPEAGIFHVRLKDGQSKVENVTSDTGRSEICVDLGYHASDLLQANCIIWVEGPSDRIYLRHWIQAKEPDLIEGVHYSIMFYGGRLLSHLTADDPEIEEFISLRRLNRHISIVIDSDKKRSADDINPTKQRIQEAFNKGPGFAWITEGREIENYIDPDVLESAVKAVHNDVKGLSSRRKYSNVLKGLKRNGGKKAIDGDKVKVANKVVEQSANFGIHDLDARVKQLIQFIQQSNG